MNAPANVIQLETAKPNPFFDADLELALIGRLLDEPGCYAEARAVCEAPDFGFEVNVRIFELCEIIEAEGEAVSYLTVRARIGRTIEKMLGADQGSEAYLSSAIAATLTRGFVWKLMRSATPRPSALLK